MSRLNFENLLRDEKNGSFGIISDGIQYFVPFSFWFHANLTNLTKAHLLRSCLPSGAEPNAVQFASEAMQTL